MIVVDEQGNEYEATYPKRAKGLVKNGRARFVGENKICLACPPDQILEEKKMSNTINKEAVLTEREIFDQIVLLQKNLSDSTFLTLVHLSNALGAAGGEELQLSDDQVANICAPFSQREETLHDLLRFYQKMYQDCSERAKQSTDTQNS